MAKCVNTVQPNHDDNVFHSRARNVCLCITNHTLSSVCVCWYLPWWWCPDWLLGPAALQRCLGVPPWRPSAAVCIRSWWWRLDTLRWPAAGERCLAYRGGSRCAAESGRPGDNKTKQTNVNSRLLIKALRGWFNTASCFQLISWSCADLHSVTS